MKNKIKIAVIIAVLIAFAGVQVYAAQQANEYRAYVSSQFIDGDRYSEGTNATMVFKTTFVPVYASATYTLSEKPSSAYIDLSQPTKINDQIAAAVKAQGDELGYRVIRVFVPSYEMKIP